MIEFLDRKAGRYDTFPLIHGNEVPSIIEHSPNMLWFAPADVKIVERTLS